MATVEGELRLYILNPSPTAGDLVIDITLMCSAVNRFPLSQWAMTDDRLV